MDRKIVEACMRTALLALLVTCAAPLAVAVAPGDARAAPALAAPKIVDATPAVTRVDYYYRGYRPYYRRSVARDYYYGPRAHYYAPPAYAPPAVVYYPPPVVYYPPPVVYRAYPPAYGYGAPARGYYDTYSDW
jgi:hypothetical protein